MKKFILSLIGLLAITLCVNAQTGTAGQYRYTTIGGLDGTTTNSVEGQQAWTFGTNSTGTAVTTNYVACTQNDSFTLLLVYKAKNAESNLVTLHWKVSPDPSLFPHNLGTTNATQSGVWTVGSGHLTNANGNAIFVTNVTVGTIGYWQCSAISNNMAAGSFITNITLRAYFKPTRAR